MRPAAAGSLPSIWDSATIDNCPFLAFFQCGSAGEALGEAWEEPSLSASCGPVTYSLTGLPAGVTGVLAPSPTASTYPFIVDANLSIDPSKPPKPGHYTYTLSANSTCGALIPATGNFWILCSIAAGDCPVLEIVDVNRANAVLTGAQVSVVGRQVNLTSAIKPNSGTGAYTISNALWTIDPNAVTAYARDGSAATQFSSPALVKSVIFYWIDGGSKNLAVSAEADRSDGQEISIPSAQFVVNVVVPSYSITLTTPPDPGIYVGRRTDFHGRFLTWGSGRHHPAIRFAYNVTNDRGFAGTIAMTQLIDRTVTVNGVVKHVTSPNSPWLDINVNYAGATRSTGSLLRLVDAPGFALSNANTTQDITDGFTDYFMYMPNDHGIWVTLATATWDWTAGATIVNVKKNRWCLDGDPGCPNKTPAPTHSMNPPAIGSTLLPTWGGILNNPPSAIPALVQDDEEDAAMQVDGPDWLITRLENP